MDRPEIIKSIELSRAAIEDVFELDSLNFSFICGSVPRQTAHPKSDIDVVVCLNCPILPAQRKDFTDNYLQLHHELERIPDLSYPGEVMSYKVLTESIGKTLLATPVSHLSDKVIYDGLVWAGMLSSNRKEIIHNQGNQLVVAQGIGSSVIDMWYKALETDGESFEHGERDQYLKEIITYEG